MMSVTIQCPEGLGVSTLPHGTWEGFRSHSMHAGAWMSVVLEIFTFGYNIQSVTSAVNHPGFYILCTIHPLNSSKQPHFKVLPLLPTSLHNSFLLHQDFD